MTHFSILVFSTFVAIALGLIAPQLNTDDEIIVPLDDEVQFTLNGESLHINDVVWVETLCYGLQPGYVQTICDNPYYGQTGMVAYIVSMPWESSWTEYLPLEVSVS